MYAPQAAFLSELFGTQRALQRRVARRAAVVGAGRRAVAAHRDAAAALGYGRGALSLYLIGMAVVTIVSVLAGDRDARVDDIE